MIKGCDMTETLAPDPVVFMLSVLFLANTTCVCFTHSLVVDNIAKILELFNVQIENNGCAYRVEGDVYFSVDNSPKYGQLSGRKLEDNRSGERVAVDSRKRNPADFALWKVYLAPIAPTQIHLNEKLNV